MVSKLHAAIERRDEGGIVLQDLGSTNGTLVNGRLLRSKDAQLNEGDRIQIGPIVATVTRRAPAGRDGKSRRDGRRLAQPRRLGRPVILRMIRNRPSRSRRAITACQSPSGASRTR